MHGDRQVLELLNEQLTAELASINQYFLHARMQRNDGYIRLAEQTRDESIDEMKHAERITDRILFLEGLPNYQRLGTVHIGQTVAEQLRADLDSELESIARLRSGITTMRELGDVTSATIFEDILADEERHIDYLETQLALLDRLGEQLYLAQLVDSGED